MWRWTKRTLIAQCGLVSVAALTGVTYQWIATRNALAADPPPGRLVDVGGPHIWCTGSGAPSVILEEYLRARPSAQNATVSGAAIAPTDTEKLVALTRLYGVVRWFHPADSAQEIDWNRFAVHAAKRIRPARSDDDLKKALETLFAPVSVGLRVSNQLPEPSPGEATVDTQLVAWRHLGLGGGSTVMGAGRTIYTSARTNRPAEIGPLSSQISCDIPPHAGAQVDVDLGRGLRARVPLVLTDAEAAIGAVQQRLLDALKTELGALPHTLEVTDTDVRTADVIVAWSVFRHFYPYWAEVGVDWDKSLPSLLEAASAAGSHNTHPDVLRRLVAEVRDGHGSVRDPRDGREQAWLPITARHLTGRLVVTASAVPEQVRIGDVITAIDGQPAAMWFSEQEALTSGSPQWLDERVVVVGLTRGPEGSRVTLQLERQPAPLNVELTHTLHEPIREVRPEQIAEIRPGVWYVDLVSTDWSTLQPRLPQLATAQAVIFDIRGYPSDAGVRLLPHLLKAPDRDRWMHAPCIIEPFGRVAAWRSSGWNLAPASPYLAGRVVFLTDARAISYGESVMGYVEAFGLGTIVGSATAGTNGNVNTFSVPSGMSITFTGMRVTRHDGSPFHLVGVQPDIRAEPTAAGVRAGGDEVFERALAILSARTENTPPDCHTTRPPKPAFVPPHPYPSVPPGYPEWFWLGRRELWIKLPVSGTWPSLRSGEKVFWWQEGFDGARETRPAIVVTGRRLDAASPSVVLASSGTNAHHPSFGGWAMLTGISTGSPGCWEISAQHKSQQLTFISWVP